jgi:hypothetical protein
MKNPDIERDELRINGFAEGDRVAIVDHELAGAYGKVESVRAGCHPEECRAWCQLVWVNITHIPRELRHVRVLYTTKSFRVYQVTHVD